MKRRISNHSLSMPDWRYGRENAHAENNPAMGLYWFLRRRELWQV
jgi:hypothetical protein